MAPIYKAVAITEHKQKTPLTLIDFEPPELEEGEIFIENVAVAQNPVDWKQIDNDFGIPSLPWTNGGDVAGTVAKVGPGVTKFKVGDRVISFLERKTARHGAFQTYSVAAEYQTLHLPESYSFEDGSTIPLAGVTAAAGLIHALGVKFPPFDGPLPPASKGEPLLVWGGASSVGGFVVQFAKYSGYTVLTTASPHNHEYLKSIGADLVFDYHDSDVVEQIRKAAGPNLSLVYDSISEKGSTPASVQSITSASGGKVAVILGPAGEAHSTDKVKVVATGAIQAKNNKEVVGDFVYGFIQELLNRKLLKPNPVKIIPGGLNGVNEGLNLGRAYKVSGEKLVYRIADTKW